MADLNIKQIYDANPSTTLGGNTLIYGGNSPYGSGDDTAILTSDFSAQLLALSSDRPSAILASTVGLDLIYDNGPSNDGVGATLTARTDNTPLILDGGEMDTVGEGINSTCFIKNQGAGGIGASFQNGLYCLSQLQGSSQPWILTRHPSYNSSATIQEGTYILISGGTQTGQFWYENNASPLAIGSDPITFAQASVSLATNNSATFAPHGGASGTVFTDWGLLCAYLATLNQDQVITIYFDPGNTTVCSLPAGTYPVPPHCAFVGVVGHLATSPVVSVLTNSSDTILTGLADLTLTACNFLSQNQTASPITISASGFKLSLMDSNIGPNVSGRKPLFSFTNSTAANIYLYGTSLLQGGAGIIFDTASAAVSNLYAYGFNFIGSSSITNPAGLTITASTDSSVNAVYAATYTGKAQQVNYAPATPGNWPVVPALVNTALDQLASTLFSILSTANTFTKAQSCAFVNLTDASTIAIDASLSNNFNLVLGGNRTLGVPTNAVAGTSFLINTRQDSTGSRTLAYSWCFQFLGGVPPVLSTPALSLDQLVGNINYSSTSTITTTIATPAVITWTAHGLESGQILQLTTTGALPTGFSANTTYWVTVIDANTFKLSTSLANAQAATFIATSGTQSGVHTASALSITVALNTGLA